MTTEDLSLNGTELRVAKRQLSWGDQILQASFDAVAAADLDGIITYANQATADLLGVPDGDAVVGTRVQDWVQLSDTGTAMREQLLAANGFMQRHFRLNTKTGREALVEMNISVLPDESGRPMALAAVARDITEREKERTLIGEMLREKELLMKEMNHRIKNNIALMESILHVKSCPETRSIPVDEVMRQTRAMGTIHELLYQNGGTDEIEMHVYLERLIQEIQETLPDGASRWQLELENLTLDSRAAVSVGLIVNELTTNAIKYGHVNGFDAAHRGRILIRVASDPETSSYALVFQNDGAPFPEHIDIDSSEVSGLGLVRILVGQLGGTIEMQRAPSPTFTIRWPSKE